MYGLRCVEQRVTKRHFKILMAEAFAKINPTDTLIFAKSIRLFFEKFEKKLRERKLVWSNLIDQTI